MELANDLIAVTAIYSTTIVTFALITLNSGLVLRAIGTEVWRSKAYYEARGLVVDEKLIRVSGWYPYYLARNKTFYGHAARYEKHEKILDSSPEIVLQACDDGSRETEQLEDYSIRTRGELGEYTIPCPQRLRQIIANYRSTLVLTERGDVYSLSPEPQTIVPRIIGRDIVEIEFCNNELVNLDRAGVLSAEESQGSDRGVVQLAVSAAESKNLFGLNRGGRTTAYSLLTDDLSIRKIENRALTVSPFVTPDLQYLPLARPPRLQFLDQYRIMLHPSEALWFVDTTRTFYYYWPHQAQVVELAGVTGKVQVAYQGPYYSEGTRYLLIIDGA